MKSLLSTLMLTLGGTSNERAASKGVEVNELNFTRHEIKLAILLVQQDMLKQ